MDELVVISVDLGLDRLARNWGNDRVALTIEIMIEQAGRDSALHIVPREVFVHDLVGLVVQPGIYVDNAEPLAQRLCPIEGAIDGVDLAIGRVGKTVRGDGDE